jgi:tRNA A37 threonylcarbamoyladenosine synthetase subunit TsaC/SUA5/YrdC
LQQQDFYISEANAGKIFVYPTDTIYGIWGVYIPENVEKIFLIKNRNEKKIFSVIAPSFEWIKKNYPETNIEILKKHLDTYHGVTYIFDYNKPWVRIIKHPIQKFVEALGKPFITTSCNISGEPVVLDIHNIQKNITSKVEYIIDGGIGWGKQSVLIDFVSNKIIER